MCSIEQCARCRRNYDTCGHYVNDDCKCEHYVLPVDNSRMFSHWYSFTGRIGRLEYALTLVIAVALYLVIVHAAFFLFKIMGWQLHSELQLTLFTSCCMAVPVYLAVAAGVKRTHDTRVAWWYSLTPLIPLFFLNIVTIVIFGFGCVFLFKDEGEEGVNEHGSNPTRPYAEQLVYE